MADDTVTVTGPDQQDYEFPAGTTKDQAVAFFKAKGIGMPSSTGQPSAAASAVDQYLASGKPTEVQRVKPSFSEQVGERIRQNVYMIPNMLDAISKGMKGGTPSKEEQAIIDYNKHLSGADEPNIGMRVLKAATVSPRMAYDMLKSWYQTPANAAGDIISGYVAHQVGAGEKPATETTGEAVPPKMRQSTPKLTPEQQAKYTADLDAANAEYQTKSQAYHDKLSKLFDDSKRQQQEEAAAFKTQTEEVAKQHADKIAKAQADLQDEVSKEASSRADWQAKMDAAAESRRMAADVDNQRQSLQAEHDQLVGDVRQKSQQLYQQTEAGIDRQWDAVRNQVGTETPVPAKSIVDAIKDARKTELRGSPSSTDQFRNLMSEIGMKELVDEEGGPTVTEAKAVPWQTLRVHSSALGRAIANPSTLGNVKRALFVVRQAVEDALEDTANQHGAQGAYQDAKAATHAFESSFENTGSIALGEGSPLARLVRAPADSYAVDLISGKAGDILAKNLDQWDPTGQLSQAVQRVRAIRQQMKALPKVKVLKEPPPFQGSVVTGKQVPEPNFPEQPRIPEKNPPTAPELKTVKRPEPKPEEAKAGPIARTVGRLTGKVAGGAIGHAAGHPLLGYGLGGELGQQMADKIAARRAGAVPTEEGSFVPPKMRRVPTNFSSGAVAGTARKEPVTDEEVIQNTDEDIQKFIDSLPQ